MLQWDVTKGDLEDGFNIVNAGSRHKAFVANPGPVSPTGHLSFMCLNCPVDTQGAPVQGYSEAGTEFEIEAAGQDAYVVILYHLHNQTSDSNTEIQIKALDQDLLWTVGGEDVCILNTISLKV